MMKPVKKPVKFFFIFALASLFPAFAASEVLKYDQIPQAIDEMLTYHVEYKKMNPQLIKRSFNLFINRFDPRQTYLLQSEVNSFLSFSEPQIEMILADLNRGQFPEYVRLNKTIIASIQRARKIRASVKTQLLSQPKLDLSSIEPFPVSYAQTQNDLYQITSKMMQNWLTHYALEKGLTTLDSPDRLKVLAYYEKKRRAHEEQYLVNFDKPEPSFALNILKAIAGSLDAHTMYYSASEASDIRTALLKQFCGVGIHLREDIGGSYVAGLIPDSPAARTNLIKSGDIIKQIDAISVDDLYFNDILKLMEGPPESKISFLFERPSTQEKIQVSLLRERISLESERIQVSSEPFADGLIGKIVMNSFYENETGISLEADLREALKDLKSQGPLYGLVLDLRLNPGGFLSQAIKTAGLFIKSGVVVIAKYSGDQIKYQRDLDPRQYYDGPLVVLTSKASASAAEILAASLQDEGAAIVVGDEKSYGKGTMQFQTITDPNAKNFYKVTVGRYYTVSGKSTQINGVKADIVVPTLYAPYEIGEKYLRYPLTSENLNEKKDIKEEMHKILLTYQQKKNRLLARLLPTLKANSAYRLEHNPNFVAFLKENQQKRLGITRGHKSTYGKDDLQMQEAVEIIKDILVMR